MPIPGGGIHRAGRKENLSGEEISWVPKKGRISKGFPFSGGESKDVNSWRGAMRKREKGRICL